MSLLFRADRPSWSGMMQCVYNKLHPGILSSLFLPMIDETPSNPTGVYITLCFISNHAERYGVRPMLTFDQPLWWKAMLLIENEPIDSDLRKIILRLGLIRLP